MTTNPLRTLILDGIAPGFRVDFARLISHPRFDGISALDIRAEIDTLKAEGVLTGGENVHETYARAAA